MTGPITSPARKNHIIKFICGLAILTLGIVLSGSYAISAQTASAKESQIDKPSGASFVQPIPLKEPTISAGPPGDCSTQNVRIQNPTNVSGTLEAKFCESTGELWLRSYATVAHVVKIVPDGGVNNIVPMAFITWGPAPGDSNEFWFRAGSNIGLHAGQQIFITATRFGENSAEEIAATQAHIDLISELLFAGDTPAPDLLKADQLFRYGMVLAEQLPVLGDAAGIFKDCTSALKGGHWYPFVDCILALAKSDQGLTIIRNGLLQVGIDIAKDTLRLVLEALSKTKQLTENLLKVSSYIFEVTNQAQDVDIRIYFPTSGTEPPLPCRLCTDGATLISHVTLPDGTVVSPGQALTKMWRIENTGHTTWGSGYQLAFMSGEQMGAPAAVIVPATSPGSTVDISVNLTAPASSANPTRVGYWQLRNPKGTYFGPIVSVTINVQSPTSHISSLTADPPSPANASQIRIHAKVDNFSNFRALRLKIDGNIVYELGAPEIYYNWNTSGYASGDHPIVAEVADQTDTSWSRPERKGLTYTLLGTSGSSNHAPNRPTLAANPAYDWYVTIGSPPQLCAQAQGDPDGDAINAYQFEATASVGTYSSGWVSSSCYTFPSVNPGTYEWHARVRDSRGGVSEWSDKWHFTVEPSGVTAYIDHFDPGSSSNAEEVRIYACSSGHGGVDVTLRVLVNDANDGSENGTWHIIKEQGSPCFNSTDVPVWRTLEYGDGPHRVRVVAMAIQPDAGDVHDEIYTLNHRRPDTPRLLAPVPTSGDIREGVYSNSRTVTFRWTPTAGATSYTLDIGPNPSPKDNPVPWIRATLHYLITSYTVNFIQDYPTLYWQVTASNDVGTNASGDQLFGIDRTAPSCAVQALPAVTYENVFQVSWSGSDNLAGIRSFDIQYMDSGRSNWMDWLANVPASRSYELFTGQPGHTYSFRCRGTDNANNAGSYPSSANTTTKIDPAARPPSPWWSTNYSLKRNITILNNMPGIALPMLYPLHLHFDNNTTPTAAELYNASQTSPKCNDFRTVFADVFSKDRVLQNCSSSAIDIWFNNRADVPGGGSNSTTHQLYYGNPNAAAVASRPDIVFNPPVDANTVGAWYMGEGSGSTLYDSSGYGNNCTLDPTTSWVTPAKFSGALHFAGGSDGPTVNCGSSSALNLQDFTFEMWFRGTGNAWGRLAGQMQPGGGQRWILEFEGGRIRVWIWTNAGDATFYTNTNFSGDTNWHHVAFTVSGTTVKLYVDGNLERTGTLPATIRSANLPLTVGSAENIMRTFAEITHVRFSNIARADYTFLESGSFARITSEPTLAAGSPIAQPITGSPDLAVASLNAYPGSSGGALVRAVLQNQGNIDTQNGFYTDLYANHLPTGSGDYTGSIRFWVNDPIASGATITLTTSVTNTAGLGGARRVRLAATTETTSTLYVQADSTGAISEATKSNNISGGLQICTATADSFENDGTAAAAKILILGQSQSHNFDSQGDQDWVKFTAQAGVGYTIQTLNPGSNADTYLFLYGTDGTTLLASNDDYGGSLASRIDWQAPASGTYYVMVKSWNPNVAGCGTTYDLRFGVHGLTNSLYLPVITR